jgi:hypothetical protein
VQGTGVMPKSLFAAGRINFYSIAFEDFVSQLFQFLKELKIDLY